MKFEVNDRVRVISAMSPFWGWQGTVLACFDGDLMNELRQYMVACDALPTASLLFHEHDLIYVGEGSSK